MATRDLFLDYQIPMAARCRKDDGSERVVRIVEIHPTAVFVELPEPIDYSDRVAVTLMTDQMPFLVFQGVVTIKVRGRGVRVEASPETATEVLEALESWSEGRPAMVPKEQEAPAPHVLVVDDDPIVLRVLARLLGRLGCKVVSADSVPSGLEMLETGHFDAVLLDWLLPKVPGQTMLEELGRQRKKLPVAVISGGLWWSGAEREIYERGAQAVLRKPLDFDEISKFIEKLKRLPS